MNLTPTNICYALNKYKRSKNIQYSLYTSVYTVYNTVYMQRYIHLAVIPLYAGNAISKIFTYVILLGLFLFCLNGPVRFLDKKNHLVSDLNKLYCM